MTPEESLGPEGAAASSLNGRVVFLLASRDTGAERLSAALDHIPGFAAAVPTHLFSTGVEEVLDHWVVSTLANAPVGYFGMVEAQELLLAARLLADAPLAAVRAARNADRVVEYSPDHISQASTIAALYPDAHLVHVVRDGRQVAARLASPAHPNRHRVGGGPHGRPARQLRGWRARDAARRWCDDQRAVLAVRHPNLHVVRIEDVLDDPSSTLSWLSTEIGVAPTSEGLESAVAAFGARERPPEPRAARPAAMVELLGADLLAHYGYDTVGAMQPWHAAARIELGLQSSIEGGRRRAIEVAARLTGYAQDGFGEESR